MVDEHQRKMYKKPKDISTIVANEEKIGAIHIDFMQNLQLPNVPIQEISLRQLTETSFVFTILKTIHKCFIFTMRAKLLKALLKYARSFRIT